MDDFPNIKIISIVWDVESEDISVEYDEDQISYYEAYGLIADAYENHKAGLRPPIEDE